jgi:hypothetical protein
MKIIRRVLLSRSTALLLMAAVGFLGLVAVTIPQVLSPAPAEFTRWKQSAGVFGDVVEGLNLHRVYNSEIFFATVALSLIVLAYSLINLVSSVRRSGGMKSAGAVDTRRMNHLSFDVAGLHSVQAIVGKLERRGYVWCFTWGCSWSSSPGWAHFFTRKEVLSNFSRGTRFLVRTRNS